MKIRFHYPKGVHGWNKDIEMDYVPRIDESINFSADDGGDEYNIKHVVHYPNDPDFKVYVVLQVRHGLY